ncbi:unnamed protein product [Larinioides sclopetarius]|uniref:THAP-type domain-containing protein n=1 Tax=Larinioides sclopetarius TaxID=280406 RepID=A0AAV2B2S8_9ARAC
MPSPFCVPNCRSNYKNTPSISVFKFPTEEEIKRKWTPAIRRKDFVPTKHSRVCIKHFTANDIVNSVTIYNQETGDIVEAPLERKRLRDGAIPSQFPELPRYLSTEATTSREDPKERAMQKEMKQLKEAITESLREDAENKKLNTIRTFDE